MKGEEDEGGGRWRRRKMEGKDERWGRNRQRMKDWKVTDCEEVIMSRLMERNK